MLTNPFDRSTVMPEPPPIEGDEERISRSPSAGKTSAHEQGLEIPMGWKPTAAEPVPVVRCTSNATTTGERCKKWSLRGTTVCRKHGGQLEGVREHADAVVHAARMNLMGMAEEAVDVLHELMQPGTAEAVRLKAVENVLNRSGIKEAIEMKVEVTNTTDPSSEIMKKLQIMRERAVAAAEPEDLGEQEEIVDAEEMPEG